MIVMIIIIDTDRSIIMVIKHDDGSNGGGNGGKAGAGEGVGCCMYSDEWLACLSTRG